MDYSYILNTAIPEIEKLKTFGFIEEKGNLVLRKEIGNSEFYAEINIKISNDGKSVEKITADVFEKASSEKYILFNVPSAIGSFVGNIRNEVQSIIDEIRSFCFEMNDIKSEYEEYLKNHLAATPNFPWPDTPEYCVFRCSNGKWFALLMKIKLKQLGIQSEEPVWVVNLKTENTAKKTDGRTIFPAYHMNKKYWITVLLTSATNFDDLCELTEKSFNLVENKKR